MLELLKQGGDLAKIKGKVILGTILTILGTIFAWLTPKQRARRVRMQLEKLKEIRKEILREPPTLRMASKLDKINREIRKMETYLQSRET